MTERTERSATAGADRPTGRGQSPAPLPRGELFLGGRRRPSGDEATAATIDPSTEEVITEVALATDQDVDEAVAAARTAADGPLRAMPPAHRATLLAHLARAVE